MKPSGVNKEDQEEKGVLFFEKSQVVFLAVFI